MANLDVFDWFSRASPFDLCAARASVYFHICTLSHFSVFVQVFCCITATVEVKFDSETVQYPHGRFSLHAPSVVI